MPLPRERRLHFVRVDRLARGGAWVEDTSQGMACGGLVVVVVAVTSSGAREMFAEPSEVSFSTELWSIT